MLLTRLRSFARLPASERLLAVRATGWLLAARAGLRLLPFRRLHAITSGPLRATGARRDDWPAAVRRAMTRASRTLPGSSCLARSLAAERLLRAGGHDARLSIGVARPSEPAVMRVSLDAHAWVESGGQVITGEALRERYRVLATFGTG